MALKSEAYIVRCSDGGKAFVCRAKMTGQTLKMTLRSLEGEALSQVRVDNSSQWFKVAVSQVLLYASEQVGEPCEFETDHNRQIIFREIGECTAPQAPNGQETKGKHE